MTDENLERAVAALPREIAPARDLWPGIRARIAARTPAVAAAGDARVWLRAAAAWLLAVGAGTAVLVARGVPARPVATAPAPTATPARFVGTADSDDVFARYDAAAADLVAAFAARRETLDPDVAAVVERSLRAIDAAIHDLRPAARTGPGAAPRQLLEAALRQKVDLLGRALRL